jgi:ABC-type nitrate/sulfonate/bicarbonate transport system ATPase subunit
MKEFLRLKHISKSFTVHGSALQVLEDVAFGVLESECVAVVGPSGCGKTTLLRLIADLEQPDTGTVEFNTQTDTRPIMWQEHRLFPWRTVRENIAYGLELRGDPRAQVDAQVNRYVQIMDLSGFESHYPFQLSGGMQQRVAMARALAVDSGLLLLDEPFASVDYMTKMELHRKTLDIRSELRKTVVYVTHDIRDALAFANRIIVLSARPAKVVEILEVTADKRLINPIEEHVYNLLRRSRP